MSDISATPPPPSSSSTTVHIQPAPSASPSVNPANLTVGATLTGFIVNRDASGNPILRTAGGDITFTSDYFLKIGSEVSLSISNTGNGVSASLISVDGQPPNIAETISGFAATSEIFGENLAANASLLESQGASNSVLSPLSQQPLLTLSGTLIAQPQATITGTPQNPLSNGTQLQLNVTTLTVPPGEQPAINTATATLPLNTNASASYNAYAKAVAIPSLPGVPPAAPLPPTTPPTALPVAVQEGVATPIPAAIPVAVPNFAVVTSFDLANNPQVTNFAQAQQVTAPAIVTEEAAPTDATEVAAVVPTVSATALETTTGAPLPQASLAQAFTIPVATPGTSTQYITATVIGNEATGEAVLQTPMGVIRLQPGTSLPIGSSVTLEIVNVTPPNADNDAAIAAEAAAPAPITDLAHEWVALKQIFTLLAGTPNAPGPGFNQATTPWIPADASGMPNLAPQNMPAGLMAFVAALRGNDFRGWLGKDQVKWLEDHDHAALIGKAASEFTSMARQFAEAEPHHWQALFFPVAVGVELHQVRLFVKRDRNRQSPTQPGKNSDDTRFVIELDLSQMGGMQMDGFVRREGSDIQFDLIIRSAKPLDDDFQKNILQIYTDTGELTGYKGSIVFQQGKEFPVNPMEEMMQHAINAVIA
jgi:hypothetical protein